MNYLSTDQLARAIVRQEFMKYVKIGGISFLLLVAVLFPQIFGNPALTQIAVYTLLFATAATSWNLFSGYTGYISLGFSTYYGLGAYTLAIACNTWNISGGYTPFLLLPLSGLVAALFAMPIGWFSLRVRHYSFVVVSIAMLFTFQLLAYNLHGLTQGSYGMQLPFPRWTPDFYNLPFYYIALVILILAVAVSWWMRTSKFGLCLLAIRDDEDRALSLGVRTDTYKLAAFIISAFFAGLVGGMVVYFLGSVFPDIAFDPVFTLTVTLMCFAGGTGTVFGPILGAIILGPVQQYTTMVVGTIGVGFDLLLFGILLLLLILFLPDGVLPAVRRLWRYRGFASFTQIIKGAKRIIVKKELVKKHEL
jgi:branched-chain amino acid transport system permease protein